MNLRPSLNRAKESVPSDLFQNDSLKTTSENKQNIVDKISVTVQIRHLINYF